MSRIHLIPELIFESKKEMFFSIQSIDFNVELNREEIGVLILKLLDNVFLFAPGEIMVKNRIVPPANISDYNDYCHNMYEGGHYNEMYIHHSLRLQSVCKALLKEVQEDVKA